MSRIHPHESQTAHEGIGSDLEHEGAERLLGRRMTLDLLTVPRIGALDGLDVEGGRKIAHHAVEKELHALVLEGRTAACGNHLHCDGALADGGDDLVLGDGIRVVEELLHQGLVALGGGLYQSVPPRLDLVNHLSRDILVLIVHELLTGIVIDRLAGNQVYDALEIVLGADGEAHGDGVGAKLGMDLADNREEVGSDPVHLVHICDLRYSVLVSLTPYGLGLGLYAAHRAESRDGAVEHTEGTLHLDGEVDMARSVDQVHLIDVAGIVPDRCIRL